MNKEKLFFIVLILILLFLGILAIFKQNPQIKNNLKELTYSLSSEKKFKKIKAIHLEPEDYYNHADIQMMIFKNTSGTITLDKDAYLTKSLYIPKPITIKSQDKKKMFFKNVSIAFTHKGLVLDNIDIYFQSSYFFANGDNLNIKNSRVYLEGDSNFHIKGNNFHIKNSEIYARSLGKKAFSSLLDYKGDHALIQGNSFIDLEDTYPYGIQIRGEHIKLQDNFIKAYLKGMRAVINISSSKQVVLNNNIIVDYHNKEKRRYFEFGKNEKTSVKFSGSIGVMVFDSQQIIAQKENYFYTDIDLFEADHNKEYILDDVLKNKYDLKAQFKNQRKEWVLDEKIDCVQIKEYKIKHHCFL